MASPKKLSPYEHQRIFFNHARDFKSVSEIYRPVIGG